MTRMADAAAMQVAEEPQPERTTAREATARRSIVVDARGLEASGIGRYTREILAAVLADPRFGSIRLLGEKEGLTGFCRATPGGARAEIVSYPYHYYEPAAQ